MVEDTIVKGTKKKKKRIPVKIDAPEGATIFQLSKHVNTFTGLKAGIYWENGQTFVEDPDDAMKKYKILKKYYGVKLVRRGKPKVVEPELDELVEDDEPEVE